MRAAALFVPLAVATTMSLAGAAPSGARAKNPKNAFIEPVTYGLTSNTLYLRTDADSGEWGVIPLVWVELANKTGRKLWGTMRLNTPFPDRACESRGPIEPKDRIEVRCSQDSVFAGVDYSVDIMVFSDSAFVDTVESTSWTFQLRRSSVKEWRERHVRDQENEEANRLPKRYEHVVLKHQVGFAGRLVGNWGRLGRGGTLTVRTDGLEYMSKKETFRLSAAQLLGVDYLDDQMFVKYDDGGKTREVAFMTSVRAKQDIFIVETSVQALIQQRGRKRSKGIHPED